MSRGPGKLQQKIVAYLHIASAPVTAEFLRWELLNLSGEIPSQLSTAWDTSVARAISNLVKRKSVSVEARPLVDLSECIRHYPGKTLSNDVRQLRINLLPEIGKLALTEGPKYGVASNEQYRVDHFEKSEVKRFGEQWQSLMKLLNADYSQNHSRLVLRLIVRGIKLFEGGTLSETQAFSELARECHDERLLSAKSDQSLTTFIHDFMSPAIAKSLQFKCHLYPWVNMPRYHRYSLNIFAVDALFHSKRSYLESLPGFQPADRRRLTEHHRGELLDKLFDQSVFRDFRFLTLNG